MADRNWGMITSGATFEALATTIIFFEDPKAALFGRRGKDGGQDARSGDGTRVFQAKHHEDGSAAKAIADAKKEAAKVAAYRTSGHARYEQWKGVTHWRLVTNAAFNTTDRQTWDRDVVPLFADQGLEPDYWERATLLALLDKYPEVDRAFFQNETRALLTLPEVRERLPVEEPYLQRDSLGAYCGRDAETGEVRSFLTSTRLFLVVHGAGGIGKTRLLVEAGDAIASEGSWQVLWANVASMVSSGTWFEAIVPERPTLLLVDEPEDEQLLRVLAEQLGGRVGRTAQWRVAVAVRSPKDPVLRFLFGPRMKSRVKELAVSALSTAEAEAMCADLLCTGALASLPDDRREDAARELARRFARHPVWLTMAVHVLETRGDLAAVPQTAEDLAEYYLDEIITQQRDVPAEKMRVLLRWVALLGTVNRADDACVQLLSEATKVGDVATVRSRLTSLVERRALIQRGAYARLLELRPDVLRDHVLLSWLAINTGYGAAPIQPSPVAESLVKAALDAVATARIDPAQRAILRSVARTEMLLSLSGSPVPLLDPFFAGLRQILSSMSASARVLLTEVLCDVALVRPSDTVQVSAELRASSAEPEEISGLFGSRQIDQDSVVLELAWMVAHAARGARTEDCRKSVLEELCAIAEREFDIYSGQGRGDPNDGRRAANLIERTLEGGPDFWSSYDDVAALVAKRMVSEAAHVPPSPARQSVLKALVQPAIALQRRQTWSDGNAFHIQSFMIQPGHPGWATRQSLLDAIRTALADPGSPVATRIILWGLLAEAHRNGIQCRGRSGMEDQVTQWMLEELTWAHGILVARETDIEEFAAARELWHWHCRFEKDPSLRSAADALEALYTNNSLAAEFEPLIGRDTWDERDSRAQTKASELAARDDAQAIADFVECGIRFLGKEEDVHRLLPVAWHLGTHGQASSGVGVFVRDSLAAPSAGLLDFAAVVAAGWVATVRQTSPESTDALVAGLLHTCADDETTTHLLQRLYGGTPPPRNVGVIGAAEHDRLRSLHPLFVKTGRIPAFVQAVGWTIRNDWATLRSVLEEVLDKAEGQQLANSVHALTDAIYWSVRDDSTTNIPDGLGPWLLDQVLRLPDLDCSGDVHWHLQEILKKLGRVPVAWLADALSKRRKMEAAAGYRSVHAVGGHDRLSELVAPVSLDMADDQETVSAVAALVDLVADDGSVGYHLPAYLGDVDPEGHLVPKEVAARIAAAAADDLHRLARIAGVYEIGSSSWRQIAKPAIAAAGSLGEEDRRSLFHDLTDYRPRSWGGARGEVSSIFTSAVDSAKQALDNETDPAFRAFWAWQLEGAEAQLRDQEEHAKEERGE